MLLYERKYERTNECVCVCMYVVYRVVVVSYAKKKPFSTTWFTIFISRAIDESNLHEQLHYITCMYVCILEMYVCMYVCQCTNPIVPSVASTQSPCSGKFPTSSES